MDVDRCRLGSRVLFCFFSSRHPLARFEHEILSEHRAKSVSHRPTMMSHCCSDVTSHAVLMVTMPRPKCMREQHADPDKLTHAASQSARTHTHTIVIHEEVSVMTAEINLASGIYRLIYSATQQ